MQLEKVCVQRPGQTEMCKGGRTWRDQSWMPRSSTTSQGSRGAGFGNAESGLKLGEIGSSSKNLLLKGHEVRGLSGCAGIFPGSSEVAALERQRYDPLTPPCHWRFRK